MSFTRFIHSPAWLKLSLKIALSATAFWLAIRSVDFSMLSHIVREQEDLGIAAAFFCIVIQIILGALRWRQILRAIAKSGEHVIGVYDVLKLYYISAFFNCCLPGTVGGDVIRVWLAKSDKVPLPLSINSVVIDRLIALAALAVIIVATLPFMGYRFGFGAVPYMIAAGVLAVFGIWLVFAIDRLLKPYEHIRPVRWLLFFAHCLQLLLRHPFMSLNSLVFAIVSHLSACISGYALARSMHIDLNMLQCITYLPPVMLAATIPLSIGGWGVREAGMVGMLAFAGIAKAQALMLSVEMGLVNIIISLPAGIVWLFYRRSVARPPEGGLSLKTQVS